MAQRGRVSVDGEEDGGRLYLGGATDRTSSQVDMVHEGKGGTVDLRFRA